MVNHKDKQVVVCYADGHYMTLDRKKQGSEWARAGGDAQSPGYIEGASDTATTAEGVAFVENPNGKGREDTTSEDDVDYPSGKKMRPLTPGSGSSRRALMK